MISDTLSIAASILVVLTSVLILISRDWRYCVASLAIQYIGVFLLVNTSWSIEMAVAKMVAGWMAGAILGIAMTSIPDTWRDSEKSIKFGPIFRILTAGIVLFTLLSVVR